MHDRVYMFFKAYHYVFLYKATILHFCLLSVALILFLYPQQTQQYLG